MGSRFKFNHLEELFDKKIPYVTPEDYIRCSGKNFTDINLSGKDLCGFIDPRVNITKNEFGIFTANNYSSVQHHFLSDELKKYYKARKNVGGYYGLYHNYNIGVDKNPLKIQTAYNEINKTEVLIVRILNGSDSYKFTITYTEGEEFICIACKIDPSEFALGTKGDFTQDASIETIFITHIISAIILLLRPNECNLNAFKDNIVFNFNIFQNKSTDIWKFVHNYKIAGSSIEHDLPYSIILGQEKNLQLTYYSIEDSFMFIVTFTDKDTKPIINPNDVYVNIARMINLGDGAILKSNDYHATPKIDMTSYYNILRE